MSGLGNETAPATRPNESLPPRDLPADVEVAPLASPGDRERAHGSGVGIPRGEGGLGRSMADAARLLDEAGRSLPTPPLLAQEVLAPRLIELLATPRQRREWLPRLASRETVATVAWRDDDDDFTPLGIALRARRARSRLRLSGQKLFVPDAGNANLLLVVARTSGSAGSPRGLSVLLIPADTPGVQRAPLPEVDRAGRLFALSFDDVALDPDCVLGRDGMAWPALDRLGDMAALGLAAESLGGTRRVLDLCATGSGETNAAAQMQLAETHDQFAPAQRLLLDAAGALDQRSRDASRRASAVKARVGDLFVRAAELACEVRGAVAPELRAWLARALTNRALYGTPEAHRERYAILSGW